MKKRFAFGFAHLAALVSLAGCQTFTTTTDTGSTTQPPAKVLVEAQAAPEAPVEVIRKVVPVPKAMPMPGQLRRLSALEAEQSKRAQNEAKSRNTWEVIEEANRNAAQKPNEFGYFNAIMKYNYAEGALFNIYGAPLKLTDIQLQPGEKIIGEPASGDTTRWILAKGKSISDGVEREHIYVKPTEPGLVTSLSINTDRRTYHVELRSFKHTYMAAVNWRYPRDEIKQLAAQTHAVRARTQQIIAPQVNLDQLNFGYDISVKKGQKPIWQPINVFDDGRKTFIQFPAAVRNREVPTLFVLSDSKKPQLVNYRKKNDYFIVDRLFDGAELRLGRKKQTIVRLTRSTPVETVNE